MALHRRHLLTALGTTGVAALAGCSSIGGNEPTETAPPLSEHTTKLARGDGVSHDYFGASVAVAADGSTAIVGAWADEDPNGEDAGSAYVFGQTGRSWTQQAKLAAAAGDEYDVFGRSVAVAADGTTALVGAEYDEDQNGREAGSAYVFDASGGTWTQQAKLAPADGDDNDEFGKSVAMSSDGTTALVGAWNDEDLNGKRAGAMYVFNVSGGSWTQQAKLAPADGDKVDNFGLSVAVTADGTTALVGAFGDEDPNGERAGSAYVFERTGGSWRQQARLVPTDGDLHDEFGGEVAMAADGTTALIGAPQDEDPNGERAGSAYVFEREGDSWTQQAKLAAANGNSRDRFGWSVAMAADGTTTLVGAKYDEDPNGEKAGSAYVFERPGRSWTQQARLTPADGVSNDYFGSSVAMAADGTTSFVGAPGDNDPNGETSGSAYIFERSGGSWRQ